MAELKPCDFCGNDKLFDFVRNYYRNDFIHLMCMKCFAQGPAAKDYSQAIDAWNRREK